MRYCNMEIKKIKALAQILEQSGLTVLDIAEGDTKIHMERSAAALAAGSSTAAQPGLTSFPAESAAQPGPVQMMENIVDYNNVTEVKSPMVGVFYASPSPEAEAFVTIGSRVKKGDVLCIIEAMKLMNELTAETDGEVIDICAENGQIVEYGQTIFKLL